MEGRIQLGQGTRGAERGNELAGRLAKEASSSKDIEECYNRIPKSTVTSELKEQCLKQWQNEWETTTKGVTTRSFFPNIGDRLQLRINPTPNFTAIVTWHGNIKTYLHKFKITENPKCPCNKGDQMVDHIIFSCKLQEQERDRLKAAITKSEQWPVSKNKLVLKYYDNFNPLNPELNPICYLLALLGAHHFLHISRIRVKSLTLRRLMSYIYGAPILDVSRSHTTQHSR